ncbi:hypothetical protein N0V93_002800 [Gnomoniopsis smithogilvyi]|uniref:Methyltransferase domain-containing protein n=1 Tax=Gnomoniopsis smithogilvyi TaxID=1191159 RepID=A0A9W8YVY5_9PEZI|nr:hypothetical protein N0V93_002800 [Gnomoniopsis smithogilvyi]
MQRPRYREELPADIGPFQKLLHEYTHLPAEQLDAHIRQIRDKAYAIAPYPGFGLWGFTRISVLEADPRYQLALSRLCAPNETEFFLDVGCGLGQNLRQLIHAGAPASKLGAVEKRHELYDLGLELFQDRFAHPQPELLVEDLIHSQSQVFLRRATILHVANLFHLFDWTNQLAIAHRLSNMLQDQLEGEEEKRVFIFGRQVGSLTPGARETKQGAEERYLHNQESFQRLWDSMYGVTGWHWKVEVEMLGKMPPGYAYLGEDARYQRFVVWRIPKTFSK